MSKMDAAEPRRERACGGAQSGVSWASMASTRVGSSGSTWGRNRATTSPVGRDEELLEVPGDVAGLALGVGGLGELGVDRVAAGRR